MPNSPVFAFCSDLHVLGGNDCDRVISIAETNNLLLFFVCFFTACEYGPAEHYLKFDVHEDGCIVTFPASSMEEASNVEFARMITLCGSDPLMRLLALKKSTEIDWGYYVGNEWPFLVNIWRPALFSTLLLRGRENF